VAAEIEQGGSVNEVITYAFDAHEIVVKVDGAGDPWFSLPAICRVTGHTNPSMAGSRIPDDEKTALNIADPNGRLQPTMFVNEAGMYRLVLTSRLHAAERFKSWIVREVLPSIRKTGGYGQPVALNLRDPRQMATIAAQLAQINEELNGQLAVAEQRVAQVEAKVERLAPKAEAFDAFVQSEGVYTLQNTGRILANAHNIGPNKFINWLKERGFLFYQDGALVPIGKYYAQGLFKLKVRDAAGKDRVQTFVTARGLAHFHALLSPQGDLLAALPPALTSTTKTQGAA
jgi:prophage antirepressor-like protein